MIAAYTYFCCMLFLMVPLSVVHFLCRDVVKKFPWVMPDELQRDRYRWGELWMGITCLAMVWYMWMVLDFMVTFCATSPVLGALAQVPWTVGTMCVLIAKTGHLNRLRARTRVSV